MPLRQIMPEPFQLTVFPLEMTPTVNALGNKTFINAEDPIIRGATSIRDASTHEIIDPAFIDRVVTRVHLATLTPTEWAEGDLAELPGLGTFRVEGDPVVSNLGPMVAFNHLFGGMIRLKRVN